MKFLKIFVLFILISTIIINKSWCLQFESNFYTNNLKSKKDSVDLINKLNQKSQSLFISNPDSAIFYANLAIKISKLIKNEYYLAISTVNLAFSIKENSNPKIKDKYFQQALSLYQRQNKKNGEALILIKIGDNYKKINNFDSALKYYNYALKNYQQLNDKKQIAFILNDKLGELYIDKSEYSKAIEVLFKSLKLSEEVNDSSGIADASTNIGVVYLNQNNFENAERYLKRAFVINKNLKRKIQTAKCMVNLGVIFTNKDSIHEALENYLDALEIYKQSNIKIQNEIYINIGQLYQLMKNYTTAQNYYTKALNNSISENNIEGKLLAYMYIADLFKENNKLTLAKANFYHSLEIAKEINSIYWLNYIYLSLANISEKQKNFDSAFHYLNLYTIYSDSLLKNEKSSEITKIEMQYEQEKKDVIAKQEKKTLSIIMTSFIIGFVLILVIALFIYLNYRNKKKANTELAEKNKIISLEQEKSDNLLLNILPETIARRLKDGEATIADNFDEASVVFIDQVDFTKNSSKIKPEKVVQILNKLYTEFDHIAAKYKLEKIKTIGDCYMAASGVPVPNEKHAEAASMFALEVIKKIDGFVTDIGTELRFRVGIDCGPVVAGIIGEKKFIYDLWGDTVNTAARMEKLGVPGKIQITDRFKNKLEIGNGELMINFQLRGEIEIKGKGMMITWFLSENN